MEVVLLQGVRTELLKYGSIEIPILCLCKIFIFLVLGFISYVMISCWYMVAYLGLEVSFHDVFMWGIKAF